MSKSVKTTYFCQSCGAESAKWMGKCPSCGAWNSMVEEVIQKSDTRDRPHLIQGKSKVSNKPKRLADINVSEEERILSPDSELNRVLGGGIVPGSVVLIGGEPGIGKSTLMLQLATKLEEKTILYVSGEESEKQIRMRAERIQGNKNQCYILSEVNTQNIFKQIEPLEPDVIIIDSIQTLFSAHIESAAGSISQIRQCTSELVKYAKEVHVPVFIIGHITKEGTIAGPKVLEHMVDTVLQFEGDRHHSYRVLRALKNRFGSVSELGIYEMSMSGLREVINPSEMLLSDWENPLSGVCIGAAMEGNRTLLIEIQSLVSNATYGTPQRSTTGFDPKRLNMLLAVIEKIGGFPLATYDIFLNITGGIKVQDPALDLAVCMSILSSFRNFVIPHDSCFIAEVGLGGELRQVGQVQQRVVEAQKMGMKTAYIAKSAQKNIPNPPSELIIRPFATWNDILSEWV